MFDEYLNKWNLEIDGEPLITHSSQLLPVIYKHAKAMLKIAISEEEREGAKLMTWWNGVGAAPVWKHDDRALLMQRALEDYTLVNMVNDGLDDESSHIICSVAKTLHSKKDYPYELLSLKRWFRSLEQAALTQGPFFQKTLTVAEALLDTEEEKVVLHGDLHHGNILHFGDKGWLAIDPKGICGERGFDFANLFCNPSAEIALTPGRFQKQLQTVSKAPNLDKSRLLKWIFAYCGLSAAWFIEDGDSPQLAFDVAELAFKELQQIQQD